jgi:hypothetical protein
MCKRNKGMKKRTIRRGGGGGGEINVEGMMMRTRNRVPEDA